MPDTETVDLHYPFMWVWRVRFGIVAAAFVAAFAIYAAIFEPPTDPVQTRWMAGVLVGALAAAAALVWYHRLLACRVRSLADGLAEIRGDRPVTRLQWTEIERLRYHRLLGRLDVSSRGGRVIRIDEHLEGFDSLLARLQTRTGRVLETRWP
jgi:hypothetical protein